MAKKGQVESKLVMYRRRLIIDMDLVEDCICEQPELFAFVAGHHAELISERNEIKRVIEITESDLDFSLRHEAMKKEEKITEKAIEQAVTRDKTVRELHRTLLDVEAEAAQWGALREAFVERNGMLFGLAMLTAEGALGAKAVATVAAVKARHRHNNEGQ